MILRGEDVVIGVGGEGTRGTGVMPQAFIPGRTPSGIAPVLEKTAIRETRGTKVASHASEITQKRAEGDLEFNLRVESIGYILKSLFGQVASVAKAAPNTSVYDHTFSILPNDPEHPSITVGLSQGGTLPDYEYSLALVSALTLEMTPDDLIKATISMLASKETEKAGGYYTPAFASTDLYFRHQDITVKIAANVAGLGAATAMKLKNMKIEIPNGARVDQNISELNPGNVLATTFEPKGSFELDYQNEDLHDVFVGGTYKAMQISISRADSTIGSSAHPGLVITFPKISFEKWQPNRPIDDVVREAIDFVAHYDETTSKAVDAVLTNLIPDYDAESES